MQVWSIELSRPRRLDRRSGLLQTIQKEIGLRQVLIIVTACWLETQGFEGLIKAFVVASKIPVKVAQVGWRNKISRIGLAPQLIDPACFFQVGGD